jgi:hypothetical protein
MERKDIRSLLLSLILGDGCLSRTPPSKTGKSYGILAIQHGEKQRDLLEWKASLINACLARNVKLNYHKNGPQIYLTHRRFKAWRKFCYPGGKKNILRILPFIRHPEFALAVWLMDDGYVEPSVDKKRNKLYSCSLRLFTCSVPVVDQEEIILWFQENFGVTPKIKFQKRGRHNYVKHGDDFPFLKLTTEESLKVWGSIREMVLQIPSMQHKFRYIEAIYQVRMIKRTGKSVNLDTLV